MLIKKIKIGGIETKNNVFFAPLAGFSDFAMRKVCSLAGAGLCFTEMVSCKGLKYTPIASSELLKTYEGEDLKAVQIFGADPEIMGEIACSSHLEKFDIIDINMGCPVPKVFSNGEGSALLQNPRLAEEIVKSVKKSGKPVTVKFRTGLTDETPVTRDFAMAVEQGGADLITIHGRPRSRYYSGEVDYKEIESAKNAVDIPVIANGGIFTSQDATALMEKTGADGVMVARGALENPLLISEILGEKVDYSLKDLIKIQVEELKNVYGKERSAVVFRKQAGYYLKGVSGGKKAKEEIFQSLDIDKTLEIILSLNL